MKTLSSNTVHIAYSAQAEAIKASYYVNDIELVNKIKSGDTIALDRFYVMHRAEFIQWAYKSFGLSPDHALDIYQDTFVIFCENVRKGKLLYLQSSLKTYIFGISKNLILQQYAKEKKIREKWETMREESGMEVESADEQDLLQEALVKCLQGLATSSQKLIRAYYFDKLSMRTIAEKFGYKNEHVVKTMKLKGVKALRKAVLEAIKDN